MSVDVVAGGGALLVLSKGERSNGRPHALLRIMSESYELNRVSWAWVGTKWLILALPLLNVGCSGQADFEPRAVGGAAGEFGEFRGGAGGLAVGGATGGFGEVPQLKVIGATRRDEHQLDVEVSTSAPLYYWDCLDDPRLLKSDGTPFRNEVPACGVAPYYLDGTYVENPWMFRCIGCDFSPCLPFPKSIWFSTDELVLAENEGTELPTDVQHFETLTTRGPYLLRAKYFTSPTCQGEALSGAVTVDIQ
ncbi:MAG TPA: hypothetical protein VFQ61_09105 [Polyangiaceae bacterium]|nr:hypothetical protein [Polyangiaceae bacterium]